MKTKLKIIFVLLIFVFSATAHVNAEMVKDINPSGDAYPYYLTDVNGTIFFVANDGSSGTELWKSDGTGAGTMMVKEITSGANGTAFEEFVQFKGMLFFIVNDWSASKKELWKSDGTETGTLMVTNPNPSNNSLLENLTPSGGYLFFAANDGISGEELWRTDGTAAGTIMVQDIYPGDQRDHRGGWQFSQQPDRS